MKTSFAIEGLKDLDIALKELPKATARNTLLRVLKKGGERIAEAEKTFAPRRSGKLAESPIVITSANKLTRRQKSKYKKESDVEVMVGPTPHPKSIQTEFGNSHQAAHPHLRPAWDGNVMGVLSDVKEDLESEIEKSRARLARKAAREIAKMK